MPGEIIGMTLVKLNGLWHVDVVNSRWDIDRPNTMQATGAGYQQATGLPKGSGSFDQVIRRSKDLDWFSLDFFSIEIFDQETRSIVVASYEQCNWVKLSGSSDMATANSKKSIPWVASRTIKG